LTVWDSTLFGTDVVSQRNFAEPSTWPPSEPTVVPGLAMPPGVPWSLVLQK